MDVMQQWLNFAIAFIETSVQWLSSLELFGVPVIGIMAAASMIPMILNVLVYKG